MTYNVFDGTLNLAQSISQTGFYQQVLLVQCDCQLTLLTSLDCHCHR